MADQSVQAQQTLIFGAVGGQRHLAAAAQSPRQRPFGGYAGGGLRVVERGKHFEQVLALGGDFDA